jgi:hypothetical protein
MQGDERRVGKRLMYFGVGEDKEKMIVRRYRTA